MTPIIFVLVALAGGAGAALRFAVDSAVQRLLPSPLPLGTVLINLTGSFALGLVTGLVGGGILHPDVLAIVGSGLLGGYTTFSTASLETVRLIQRGRIRAGLVIGLGVVVVGVAAASAGLLLGAAVSS